MKKKLAFVIILLLSFCTACSISEIFGGGEKSVEELLDTYIDGYMNADFNKATSVYPPFVLEANKAEMTQESLNSSLAHSKEEFGDDLKITYEITEKNKIDSSELDTLNTQIKEYYKTSETVSECYKINGTITFTGSKFTDPDPLMVYHCNYKGSWYLVGM